MRYSIRTRLTFTFVSLAVGPLLLVGILLGWRSYTQQRAQALVLQQQIAESVGTEIGAFFKEIEGQLAVITQIQGISSLSDTQLTGIISQLPVVNKAVEAIYLLDEQGQVALHVSRIGFGGELPDEDWSQTASFLLPMASGQTAFGEIAFDPQTSEPLMLISQPLEDVQTGDLRGVLVADIRIKPIWDLIAGLRLSSGENVFVLDDRDRVVAHHNPSVVLRKTEFVVTEDAGVHQGLEGESVVYAVNWLHFGGRSFAVVAEKPVPQALALAMDTVLVTVVLVGLFLLVAFGLRAMTMRQIISPLEELAETAQAVQGGDLTRKASIESDDEIGKLAATFNQMTAQLRQSLEGLKGHVVELEAAKDALHISQEKYQELFENANDVVYTHDLEGNFTSVNRAAERVTGYSREEALQLNIAGIVAPAFLSLARSKIASKLAGESGKTTYELDIIRKDGRHISLEVSTRLVLENGRPVAVQGIARDITARKEAEAALQQTQKLESIGLLAGGIAHDFNNLLTGMLAQSSLALSLTPQDSPSRDHLEKVITAAEQASDLTHQLLAYAGKGRFQVDVLSLNEVVKSNLGLLETAVPKQAVLETRLAPDIPGFEGDRGQIQQVVMNLVINAADAVAEDNGRITIQTSQQTLTGEDHEPFWSKESPPAGEYVCLEVADNGVGMDPETMSRIFDPFFSTKEEGRGLGLSATLGIIRAHQGGLQLESQPGTGTRFRVFFPVSPFSPPSFPQVQTAAAGDTGGLVLVIDDEEPVRAAITDILATANIQVLTAENGKEGLEKFQKHRDEISLVLLDMQMPVMNGEETFSALRAIDPNIKVLLSSGYTENEITRRFSDLDLTGFLQKPYNFDTLIQKVQAAMAQVQPIG